MSNEKSIENGARFTVVQHAIWDDPALKALSHTAWRVALSMLRATLARSNESGLLPEKPKPFTFGPSNIREMSRNTFRRAVDELLAAKIVKRMTPPRNGDSCVYTWTLLPVQLRTRSIPHPVNPAPGPVPELDGYPVNSAPGTRSIPHPLLNTKTIRRKTPPTPQGGQDGAGVDAHAEWGIPEEAVNE